MEIEITPYWPQWVIVVTIAMDLLLTAHEHGKPRSNYNFWTTLIATIISAWTLYAGGFWRFG